MARSDKHLHEKKNQFDAGKRTLRRRDPNDRASVGLLDYRTRAEDLMRALSRDRDADSNTYKHTFSIGYLAYDIGLPKAHELLNLPYQEPTSTELDLDKNNATASSLSVRLWEKGGETLEKLNVHYFLLRLLDDPTKAEALRQSVIKSGGKGEYDIELTESEYAQISSKLKNLGNVIVKE